VPFFGNLGISEITAGGSLNVWRFLLQARPSQDFPKFALAAADASESCTPSRDAGPVRPNSLANARKFSSASARTISLLFERTGKKRAIVATARKLAVLLHHLWVSGEVYEPLHNSCGTKLATAA
jgi:hypothetical protein